MSPRVSLFAVILVAAGCGGGGYDGASANLSVDNAERMSQQGVEAATTLTQMASLVENYAGLIESQAAQTVLCDQGTASLDINDAVPQNEISTGDSVSITFAGCQQNAGGLTMTLNGTLSFTADNVTGSPPGPYTRVFTATYDALTVTFAGVTIVVDGSFTLTLSSTDGITTTAVVSGASFTVFAQAGSRAFSGSIADFRIERAYNQSNDTFVFDYDATVSGSAGGPYVYETTTAFTGAGGEAPSAGVLTITGPLGGEVTLTALNNTDVRIVVDLEGDGTPRGDDQHDLGRPGRRLKPIPVGGVHPR